MSVKKSKKITPLFLHQFYYSPVKDVVILDRFHDCIFAKHEIKKMVCFMFLIHFYLILT